jgi:hypothetical protein
MSAEPSQARALRPHPDFITRMVGDVLKAILAYVSNSGGGNGVEIRDAIQFLDDNNLAALDAALTFSPDHAVSSVWSIFLRLDSDDRDLILLRARAELVAAPADSFVPHEYISALVTRAA